MDFTHHRRDALQQMDNQLLDLEFQACTACGRRRSELRAAMAALRVKRDAYQSRLDDLRTVGEEAWRRVRRDLRRTIVEFREAASKVLSG